MPKINDNGITRDMTPEEEAAYLRELENAIPPEPTPEERLNALEVENKNLKEALDLLLSGVTTDE